MRLKKCNEFCEQNSGGLQEPYTLKIPFLQSAKEATVVSGGGDDDTADPRYWKKGKLL